MPSPTTGSTSPGSEEKLALLERRLAAQAAALDRVPAYLPLPADLVALLALAPSELDGAELPLSCLPRLMALHGRAQALVESVTLRERELAERMARVRAARRTGPPARLVDYRG